MVRLTRPGMAAPVLSCSAPGYGSTLLTFDGCLKERHGDMASQLGQSNTRTLYDSMPRFPAAKAQQIGNAGAADLYSSSLPATTSYARIVSISKNGAQYYSDAQTLIAIPSPFWPPPLYHTIFISSSRSFFDFVTVRALSISRQHNLPSQGDATLARGA